MKQQVTILAAAFAWILIFNSSAQAEETIVTSTIVAGTEDMSCQSYLRKPQVDTQLPLIFYMAGTGIYSTGDDSKLPPTLQVILSERKAMVLTIDKPGISKDSSLNQGFIVDDQIYNRYTQNDLVACAIAAMEWVTSDDANHFANRIFLMGHSEGAQVSVRILKRLIESDSVLKDKVEKLILSGLPMDGWRDIIRSQLNDAEWSEFQTAYANKEDAKLKTFGGLAHLYWQDIFTTEPLKQTLRELWDLNPKASFAIYHGIDDKNTSVQPVWDFESENRLRQQEGKSSLDFQARYYQAPHQLNLAALNDMIFLLLAYL